MLMIRAFALVAFCSSVACSGSSNAPPSPVLVSEAGVSSYATKTASTSHTDAGTDATGDASATQTVTLDYSSFLVVRVGDGETSRLDGSTTAPVYIERRNSTDGSLLATLPVRSTATSSQNALTLTGKVGEGALSLSDSYKHVSLAGYNMPISRSVSGVTGATIADLDGALSSVDTSTLITNSKSGFGTIYSAARHTSETWLLSQGGVDFTTFGTSNSSATRFSDSPRRGELHVVGAQLYATDKGGGIFAADPALSVGGDAGTPDWTTVVSDSLTGSSVGGFVFLSTTGGAADVLYVANSVSGLQRWKFNSTKKAWVNCGTLNSLGVRHVMGFVNKDATVTLIATSSDGSKIYKVVDDLDATSVVFTTLAVSASTSTSVYLGVSPVPAAE